MKPVVRLGIERLTGGSVLSRAVLLGSLFLLLSLKGWGQLSVDFSANVTTVCIGAEVTFTDATSGVTGSATYSWNFGATASPSTATGPGPHTVTYSSAGSFTVSLTVTDDVGSSTETKTNYITVTPDNTITLTSSVGSDVQTVCINTALNAITYVTTGAEGATFTGLPSGVTGTWASDVVTISGTPTASGTFPYTVTLTGGCGTVTASGTITSNSIPETPVVTVVDNCDGTSTLSTTARVRFYGVHGDNFKHYSFSSRYIYCYNDSKWLYKFTGQRHSSTKDNPGYTGCYGS